MSLLELVLVILILVLVGVLPRWPYSSSWGYGPASMLLVLFIVLAVIALAKRV